jgi:hypothetical protein
MGASPNPEDWSLEYTPSGAMATTIPRVANEAACGGNAGWYFDNADNDVVKLCGESCSAIKTNANPKTELLFGCAD